MSDSLVQLAVKETVSNLNFYCPLPFRHIFVDSTGVSPCCQLPRQNINIDSWIDSDFLKSLQQKLSKGEVPAGCQSCVNQEKKYGTSLRLDSWKDYEYNVFTDTKIDFIDYRYSNICNFKCRSCNGTFSHGIAKETRENVKLQKYLPVVSNKTVNLPQTNQAWVIGNIRNFERLMFTGGEPTLIPEVRSILTYILDNKLNHISVMITSNGSWKDDFWYKLTEKLPNIHWTISVDATADTAEVVRHGTDWKQVYKNLSWLAINSPSLDINTVVSNINLLNLRDLLILCRDLQKKSCYPNGKHGDIGARHQFFVCQRPYYLAADNWPDDIKPKVICHLQSCLVLDLDVEQRSMIENLLHQIKHSVFDDKLWEQTIEYNSVLDAVRNENSLSLLGL